MFLFWNTIKNWFIKIGENISFTTLIVFLMGILVGLVIAGCFYGIMLFLSLKQKKKKQIVKVTEEEINDIVLSVKQEFIKNTKGVSVTKKVKHLEKDVKNLVTKIAKCYYPKSKYPIYELSISEVLTLLTYITERLNAIFDKKTLVIFKYITISQIIRMFNLKKRLDESRFNKFLEKIRFKKIAKYGWMAKNIINPNYWLRKILVGQALFISINKIADIVLDIVAEETNKIYSKKLFNNERKIINLDLENNLQNLEEFIEEDNHE